MSSNSLNKGTNLNLSSNLISNLSETSVISNDDFEYNDFTSSNNGNKDNY
jgi:hypothetical protein